MIHGVALRIQSFVLFPAIFIGCGGTVLKPGPRIEYAQNNGG